MKEESLREKNHGNYISTHSTDVLYTLSIEYTTVLSIDVLSTVVLYVHAFSNAKDLRKRTKKTFSEPVFQSVFSVFIRIREIIFQDVVENICPYCAYIFSY